MGGVSRPMALGVLVAAAVLEAVLATPAAAQPGGGPPPARVVLGEAKVEQIQQWREVTGELRAPRRSVLAAQEEGLVVEIGLDPGDEVAAGQVVAKLDDARARISVARAEAVLRTREAEVTEAVAAVEKARRDYARLSESFQRTAASRAELDDSATAQALAEARLERAHADLATARAELERAAKQLADMEIRAPFAGRVVEKRTEAGQWVRAGDSVLEVLSLDTIEAWLDVPEALIDQVSAPGAVVQVRVAALRDSEGRGAETRQAVVTGIVPLADRLSRLFPVRVRLDNNPSSAPESWGGRLKPGMSVVGLIPGGTRQAALTVPKDAVLRNETGAFVYFMDGNGAAAMARVDVLFAASNGERLAVRSDRLLDGARVVTEGNERLFPGQPLQPIGGPGQGG